MIRYLFTCQLSPVDTPNTNGHFEVRSIPNNDKCTNVIVIINGAVVLSSSPHPYNRPIDWYVDHQLTTVGTWTIECSLAHDVIINFWGAIQCKLSTIDFNCLLIAPDPSTTQWPHSRGVGAAEKMYGSAARIWWWPRKWSLWLPWLPCFALVFDTVWSLTLRKRYSLFIALRSLDTNEIIS